MSENILETDYLVIGAGAMGMSFVDEILTQDPVSKIVLIDKHDRPGGHWNDAYSFVSLHQPAAYYGVNSEKLGCGGANLASGAEVISYYERVLKKFIRTKRVQFFSMCKYDKNSCFSSILRPSLKYKVIVRKKIVDATYMKIEVPSTRKPLYFTSPDTSIVSLNYLSKIKRPYSMYVIIGAGKTGIDAILFLLKQGVASNNITWIVSNDSWFWDRAHMNPKNITAHGMGAQMENFLHANSLRDVFYSLESDKRILRLDKNVWPTKYRCATVNKNELEQLRQIKNIVRMGRITHINGSEIVLEKGTFSVSSDVLYVDCTASGLGKNNICPVFDGKKITLQSLFMCQAVFSAAVIGLVEAKYNDEEMKNKLCQVVQQPEFSRDYVVAMIITLDNLENWLCKFYKWLRRSRLCFMHHESVPRLFSSYFKLKKIKSRAVEKMRLIIGQEFGGVDV